MPGALRFGLLKRGPRAPRRGRPRLHVFGNIHDAYGTVREGDALFVNASNCKLAYEPDNPVIVVDVPLDRALPAVVVPAG